MTVKINQIRKWDRKREFNKTEYNEYFIVVGTLAANDMIYVLIRSFEDGFILKYSQGMIEDCSYEVEDKDGTEYPYEIEK